jgi:ferrous iron transport protein B
MALNFLCHDDTLLQKYIAVRLSHENLEKIISVRRELENLFSKPLRQVIHSARIKTVNALLPQVQKLDESSHSEAESLLNIGAHPMISVVFLGIMAFLGQQTFENFSLALVPVWISFFLLCSLLRPNIISSLEKSATHRFYGWFILAAILVFTYYFVGVFGAGTSVDFIENTLFGKYINPKVTQLLQNWLPIPFVVDLLVNETYGIITVAITYAVAIILPIVTFFFLLFGILEDSGYLPRLAVMVNHIFKKMGLNGKAVLPMVLGLGCDTMATLTARILPTKKERMIVTLLLALGVPCSAQLGVIRGMLSAISISSIFILSGVILAVMFAVGYLSAKLLPGQSSDFIQELPVIRVPKLTNIFVKTFARVEWYLKEALPLFVLGTFFLFVLYKLNLIHTIERIASPVVETFLGLPKEATKAFIIGFLRRDYAATEFFTLSKADLLSPLQILVGLVTITLFVPCLANFFIMVKERGLKQATYMVAFIFPFAFLVGGLLNHSLKWIGYGA